MYTDKRTIDHILASFSAHVRETAIRELAMCGITGVDPRDDGSAPTTFEQLVNLFQDPVSVMPVNTEGSDKTIYSTRADNLLFRAWHDHVHYYMGAPFTRGGEHTVARVMASKLKEPIDKQLMMADIVDQFDEYVRTGHYVDDQCAFVIGRVFGKDAHHEVL